MKTKPVIKSAEKIKKPGKTLLKIAGIALGAVVGATSIFSAGLGLAQTKIQLPTKQEAIINMQQYGVENLPYSSWIDNYDYSALAQIKNFISEKYVTRLALPTNGAPIKINFNFNVNEEQKMALSNAVNNFNYIFGDEKTDYKFEINFNPSIADINNIYNLNVYSNGNFKNNEAAQAQYGILSLSHKGVITSFGGSIDLKTTLLKNVSNEVLTKLENTFTHELCHSLGLGDAYIQKWLENIDDDSCTVMGLSNIGIQKVDIALLLALYEKTGEDNKQKIVNFINNFNDQQFMTYGQKQVLNQINNLVSGDVLKQILTLKNLSFQQNWQPEFDLPDELLAKITKCELKNDTFNVNLKTISIKDNNATYSYLSVMNFLDKGIAYNASTENVEKLSDYGGITCGDNANYFNVMFGNYLMQIALNKDNEKIECTAIYEICSKKEYDNINQIIENAKTYIGNNPNRIPEVTNKIAEKYFNINKSFKDDIEEKTF